MTVFRRVQGDINDTIVPILNGVEDLTTATAVEAHVWLDGEPAETLTAIVLDATNRTIEVELGAVDGWLSDAAPNTWYVEYQVTFADDTVLTWPAGSPDIIMVRAQGAPAVP